MGGQEDTDFLAGPWNICKADSVLDFVSCVTKKDGRMFLLLQGRKSSQPSQNAVLETTLGQAIFIYIYWA